MGRASSRRDVHHSTNVCNQSCGCPRWSSGQRTHPCPCSRQDPPWRRWTSRQRSNLARGTTSSQWSMSLRQKPRKPSTSLGTLNVTVLDVAAAFPVLRGETSNLVPTRRILRGTRRDRTFAQSLSRLRSGSHFSSAVAALSLTRTSLFHGSSGLWASPLSGNKGGKEGGE